jgi:cell division protein ZapA
LSGDAQLARVSVRILEKEYQFACAVEERAALLDSAEYLNAEMRKIRDSGKVVGLDRIAVMAALNMANELLKSRARAADGPGEDAVHRLRVLRERVEATLERGQQVEI